MENQQGRGLQHEALLNTVLPLPPVSVSTKLVSALKAKQIKFILPKSNILGMWLEMHGN